MHARSGERETIVCGSSVIDVPSQAQRPAFSTYLDSIRYSVGLQDISMRISA